MLQKMKSFLRRGHRRSLVALAALGLLALVALPAGSAAAASAADVDAQSRGERLDERLALLYQRLQLAAQGIALRLDTAETIAARAGDWIAELQAQGVDTAELETALAAFNAGRAQARAGLDQANAVLNAAAGFDGAGSVTDRAQAAETVRLAGRALRDASRTLADATIDFRRVVGDFLRARRGQ